MNKQNKILSCIQILVIMCLIVCNGGAAVRLSQQSKESLCKERQCGCKSESDCKTNCCCTFRGNQNTFQNNNSLQAFISSINCKYGNDPFTGIAFPAKYIKEDQVQPVEESFLCFLFSATSIYPSEIIASHPEKPPPYFL